MSLPKHTCVIIESPYSPGPRPKTLCSCTAVHLLSGDVCDHCVALDEWLAILVKNKEYARKAMRDSLMRGEAPFLSHLLYTQPGVLNDDVPEERAHGIDAGFAWRALSEKTVVYTDLGISKGMQAGIDHALAMGHPIEYRKLEE